MFSGSLSLSLYNSYIPAKLGTHLENAQSPSKIS